MTRLLLVGGGRMGEALAGGLLGAGWPAADLAVVEVDPARRESLQQSHPGVTVVAEIGSDEPSARGAVLAVKPADVPLACRGLGASGIERVLSIAAGVTLATLESNLPAGTHVVRAMPNTPALVGAGVAAIAPGSSADDEDLEWAEGLLGAVGAVVRTKEDLLDAVTGLSGSGPAYLFLVAEALTDAGVLAGLPRDISTTLAVGTVLGAGRMLAESGDSAEVLRAAVTSPGGTTAAGLRALEAAGLRSALIEAVMAATARSREMGRGST